MGSATIRPYVAGDRAGVLHLAPRLAEGVAAWRDPADVAEQVVAEGQERRGIGRLLVEAVVAWADADGLSTVTLETGAANAPARRFYAGLGFAEEDVRLALPLPLP